MIDRNSSTPLYQQVSSWIREKIYAKEWTANDKIPSEYELVKKLNVSRGTVKKAISHLIDEGILISIQGKGTFVYAEPAQPSTDEGLLSIAESLERRGIAYSTEVVEKKVDKANKDIARLLNIKVGDPILYLKRVRSVNNEPVMVIENRINISNVFELVNSDFTKKSLFDEIERISSKKIKKSHTKYAARYIGGENAKYLNTQEDAPILHMEQTVFLENDEIIEWGNVWLKANRYIATTTLQRG